ncbi:helicase-exonuclease AddAB subunit AddB [Clostridium tarantellae]|uniref:ATP-dependent helicase/deoxyribonuclease subunit B n=1 Tax=Clostridium tarantellae TaxID=39493 RepID=A0A6I1MTD0_9CLOT|nr:helicase-exonuclease AddAB subunit AddB [Clostridium tarantellae]MPQ44131.1 helicase-exonuclease AddAB subunit AddB [Clostridium tarantellae]
MGLRIIYGRAGTGKSYYCINQIKKKIEKGVENKLLLIVPEQFTFQTENKILNNIGEKYVLYADVLSFKRLAYKVFNKYGGLNKKLMKDAGKSMLIYRLLEDLSNEMTIFSGAAKQAGFIDIVSKTITEFKKYNITEEILNNIYEETEDENLKLKIQDLKLLFSNFNIKLHENYIDGEDQLDMLSDKLEDCNMYDGAEVWIDEFTTFTPQQIKIILKLIKRAKTVNITLSLDENNVSIGDSDLFAATKSTEKRLIRAIEENNLPFKGYINLNEEIPFKFKEDKELYHIERQMYFYPFKEYKGENKNVRLYKANNSYDEIEFIAKDILRLIREKGYRFKDIAIVCRNIESYEKISTVIFNEYEIPYYIDKKMDVASNPLIVLITSAIDIVTKNWNYESMFKYLKSGLVGIETEHIDILENYVLANGIKGDKWDKKWQIIIQNLFKQQDITEEDKEHMIIINKIREQVIVPLKKFYEKCTGKKTLRELSKYLYEFLDEDLNVIERIDKVVTYFEEKNLPQKAKEYSQVLDIFIEVLDQAVEVLGEEVIELKEFSKILNVGFSKYEMGLIPISLDEVTVGDITRVKSNGAKAVYIVGVNDGVLPSVNKDEGILSDKDREFLKFKGIDLASDTKTKMFEEQFLVYTALTISKEYLVITYPLSDFEGKSLRPSIVVHRLKKILPNIIEESESFKHNLENNFYYKISSKVPTFNELIGALRKNYDGKVIEEYWSDVYNWFKNHAEWIEKSNRIFKGLAYTNLEESLSKEKIKKLYGDKNGKITLSVSRLEKYAQCPFAYYVQYGLKAKDRKIYEFTSPDLGNFMHEILDEFTDEVRSEGLKWCDLNIEKCREIINILVEKQLNKNKESILNSSKRYKYFTDRFKRILTKSVVIISEQMKRSNFEVFKNEFAFGTNTDGNPIKIELSSGEVVYLTGRIDRIDTLSLEDKSYLRIIDYKSGNTKFDLNKLYNGLQIQLLVYLDALIKNSENIIKKQAYPGAILYFKIDDPIIKSNKNLNENEIKEKVLKELKMDGLLLKDIEVVKCMDNELESGYSLIIPAAIKKDGELRETSSVITKEQFDILRAYVNEKMIEICNDILTGKINIEPCKEDKITVCDFCDYSHICQFDSGIENNKYNVISNKNDKELWNEMGSRITLNLGEGK